MIFLSCWLVYVIISQTLRSSCRLFRLTSVFSSIVIRELLRSCRDVLPQSWMAECALFQHLERGHPSSRLSCLSGFSSHNTLEISILKKGSRKPSPHLSILVPLHHWSIMSVVLCECAEFPCWEYTHTHSLTQSICSLEHRAQKRDSSIWITLPRAHNSRWDVTCGHWMERMRRTMGMNEV